MVKQRADKIQLLQLPSTPHSLDYPPLTGDNLLYSFQETLA